MRTRRAAPSFAQRRAVTRCGARRSRGLGRTSGLPRSRISFAHQALEAPRVATWAGSAALLGRDVRDRFGRLEQRARRVGHAEINQRAATFAAVDAFGRDTCRALKVF